MKTKRDLGMILAGLFIMLAITAPGAYSADGTQPVYVIGEGDVLDVFVWKNPELSRSVIVRPDGMITIPLVQDVRASGLTVAKLRDNITAQLSNFVNRPDVSVIVSQARSYLVYLFGAASTNGVYNPVRPVTAMQLLSQAGGARPEADLAGAYVVREEKAIPVDLSPKLKSDAQVSSAALLPGDTLVIPAFDEYARRILVLGEVRIPKAISFKEGLTVLDVFLESGGATDFADLTRARIVRRNGKSEKEELRVDLARLLKGSNMSWNIPLAPGDVLSVPNREEFAQRVLVVGEVRMPRSILFREGMTVMDAFVDAGGATEFADIDSVKVVRRGADGNKVDLSVDLEEVMSKGDLARNIPLEPGDIIVVPR